MAMEVEDLDSANDRDNQQVNLLGDVATNHDDMYSTKMVTCCDRVKALFYVVRSREIIMRTDDGDHAETHLIIYPEAFRMWFYLLFFVYFAIGVVVTAVFSDLDYEDNLILNTYGANSICIFFDDPPFTFFSAALYVPAIILMLLYEYFDHYRVYDNYIDNNGQVISKTFYHLYTAATIYECVVFICFIQCLATTPYENLYVHTIPYEFWSLGLFTLAVKKCLYFDKIGMFEHYHRCYYYLGRLYVFVMFVSMLLKTFVIWPNLFGDGVLWKSQPWTVTLTYYNLKLYAVLILVCPVIIYFIITRELQCVTLIMKVTKKRQNKIEN